MDKEEFALRLHDINAKLYRIAFCYLGNREDAKEALDEAVYKGLYNLKKLREPKFFETWLIRIVINECKRELKRRKRFSIFKKEDEKSQEDINLDNLSLKEALRELPEELKEVVILRFFSGFSQKETGEILEIPQGTVATRQRKALQLLKLNLEEGM